LLKEEALNGKREGGLMYLFTLKKDKRGSLAIEIVIGMLIFLTAMALLLDVFLLTWQISEISTVTAYVSSVSGNQGGINASPPIGWNNNVYGQYSRTSDIHRQISNMMSEAKIKKWKVEIINPDNGTVKVISQNSGQGVGPNLFFDYGKAMIVRIEYEVGLETISRMLPENKITNWTMRTSRTVLGDYKERFDGIFNR
jgi:hypothetical protein